MKKSLLALFASLLVGCSLFSGLGSPPGSPSTNPQTRADARAVVLAMAYGVYAAGEACAGYVNQTHDLNVKAKCLADLVPATDIVNTLAASVDTWTQVDMGQLGCAANQVVMSLKDLETTLKDLNVSLPSAVDDALSIASNLAPSCPVSGSDGGSK